MRDRAGAGQDKAVPVGIRALWGVGGIAQVGYSIEQTRLLHTLAHAETEADGDLGGRPN